MAAQAQTAPFVRVRAVILVLACILAYANSLSGPFIFDDRLAIVENPQIREWWKLGTVLSPERELPTAGRPLVNLSFALNYAVGGLRVTGYHIVNLALHLLSALLLFGIVRRTLELPQVKKRSGDMAPNLGLAVALLWTLHPLNTESVNYVTQRTELMMAFFYLLTLYAGIRAWNRLDVPGTDETYQQQGGYFTRSDAESRQFWYWVYATFLELLGVSEPGDLPRKLYGEFVKHETYRLYADSLPALRALRERGVLLGVISNWEDWLEQLLGHLEIDAFFAATVISGRAGVEKPDPRIFALALESLGLAPHEAVHVGDSVRHDVEGARGAGLLPVLVDRLGQQPPGDYLCVADLTHLPDLLGLDGPSAPRRPPTAGR